MKLFLQKGNLVVHKLISDVAIVEALAAHSSMATVYLFGCRSAHAGYKAIFVSLY